MSKEYDNYIQEHQDNVRDAYLWLSDRLPDLIPASDAIKELLSWHDFSKYRMDEYEPYDNYFYIYKDKRSKEIIDEFDKAFLHHIHSNPHHWQHWVLMHDDPDNNGKLSIVAMEMPDKFVIEMICDWLSFSIKKNDFREILSWYKEHKDVMILHENTRKRVEEILAGIDRVTSTDE